jgi:hypothetical protein
MMRLRGQQGQQGQQQNELSDQEFLNLFYNKLTISNFKDKIKTEADALRYCQASGILPTRNTPPPYCPKHPNIAMKILNEQNRNQLGFRYVCSLKPACNIKLEPTKNTWFYNANIDLRQGLHIILCFVAGLRHNQAVREVEVDDKTIGDWFGYLREVQEVVVSQPRKIGGIYEDENGEIVSHFVEVDEGQICNRKYNRGRLYNTETSRLWIVGGVCRLTRQAFMVRVPNRTIDVIDYLLETRIELGSILITDAARVYMGVHNRIGMEHESVNHSLNFVNPRNSAINTNMIESRWAAVKQKVKSYKFEYLNLLNEKYSYGEVYKKLVSDIVRVYVGPDPNRRPLELVIDDWDEVIQ